MVILEQPIDTSEVQVESHSITLLIFMVAVFVGIACLFYMPSYKAKKKQTNVDIVDVVKIFPYGVIFIIILMLLLCNAYRVITPLQVPVYGKSYNNTFFTKLGTQNVNAQSFTDKYKNDINAAINDKLNKYHIPDCEINKPQKETSLLCGGYVIDRIPAVEKDTGATYMLTPKFDYNYKNPTVTLTIREEVGYQKNY